LASSAGSAAPAPGKIQNREQAFQAILQIAAFFKRTEPQSPIAYKLEEAVRWGRMPLPDLLAELISEDGVRSSVFKLMGIHKKQSEGNP
jgi:type VI secretion system protein ImpA